MLCHLTKSDMDSQSGGLDSCGGGDGSGDGAMLSNTEGVVDLDCPLARAYSALPRDWRYLLIVATTRRSPTHSLRKSFTKVLHAIV